MSKISNSVGRNDNFLAKARKLSILPTELDFFIYGNTIYVFPIHNKEICHLKMIRFRIEEIQIYFEW